MANQSRCTYGKSALSSSFPGAGFNVCVDYECCVSGTLLALSDLTRSPLSTTGEERYVMSLQQHHVCDYLLCCAYTCRAS